MDPCSPRLTSGTDLGSEDGGGRPGSAHGDDATGGAGRERPGSAMAEPASGTSPPPCSRIKSPFSREDQAMVAGRGDIPGDTLVALGDKTCPWCPVRMRGPRHPQRGGTAGHHSHRVPWALQAFPSGIAKANVTASATAGGGDGC